MRGISVENILDSDKLIMPYVQMKDGYKYTRTDAKLKLIAPTTLAYTLNTDYFNTQIAPTLGQVNLLEMSLDCGNGQVLLYDMTNKQFVSNCIYFHKGEYPLNVQVGYLNVPTGEKLKKSFSGGSLVIDTEILITPSKGEVTFNDAKTEMNIGKVPSKVTFDASKVFTDLGINDYKITWDGDGDGSRDKQNQASATFVYKEAKLYTVNIRFPLLNDYIYTFPIRVEQSDVPVCEIIAQAGKETNYDFQTRFLGSTVIISEYQFDIVDTTNKKTIIEKIKSKSPDFSYQFPGK